MKKRMITGSLQRCIRFFILLLILPAHLSAQEDLDEKMVTVTARNKQIQQILSDISLQTGFFFTYDASLLDAREKIDFQVQDLPLRTALDSLLRDPGIGIRLIDKNIVLFRKNSPPPVVRVDTLPEYFLLTGHISDSRSKHPLPYATIALVGSSTGTISNQNGDFKLKIPDSCQDPILAITFIGYKNQYLPVDMQKTNDVLIELDKDIISLQEVVIRYQDPVMLLQEAVKRIPQNYLDQPSKMTGFYRESVRRNNKYLIFSEAVLEIAKCSYTAFGGQDRSRVFRGRKITNIGVEDTVLLKISSGINSSLQLDIARYLPDFLTEDFETRYNYEFSDIVAFNDRLVYEIHFRQKDHISETLYTGNIYLDQSTLAIVAADFELDPVRIGKEQDMFVLKKSRNLHLRPVTAAYHIEYSEANGKYHFGQARAEVKFRLRKKREWISSQYSTLIELAITSVEPGKTNQFKASEALKPRTILSDEVFEYDPEFWGDYNTIVPEASLQDALKLIGKQLQELQEFDLKE